MFQQEVDQSDEPVQFRGQTKSKIHEEISKVYLLPDMDARCSTRAYLISVFRGTAFRVRRQEILSFEVNLSPDHLLKSSFFNLTVLKERASVYLAQLQYPVFGFPLNTNPDEVWFSRVLRYIDPFNVLGAFRLRIPGAPIPKCIAGRM